MRVSLSKRLTLGAMVIALNVLALYAASVLPWSKFACIFLSALFVYALCGEGFYVLSLLAFLATSAISFALLPDRAPLYAYVALLGHYGIFKTFIEGKLRDKLSAGLLKLLYCNICTAGAVAFALYVLRVDVLALLTLPDWTLWMLLLALEGIFIGGDLLYSLCQKIYKGSLRDRILPRR